MSTFESMSNFHIRKEKIKFSYLRNLEGQILRGMSNFHIRKETIFAFKEFGRANFAGNVKFSH